MSCLMEALEDKRVRLQPECKKRLNDRIEMWSYAAKVKSKKASDMAASSASSHLCGIRNWSYLWWKFNSGYIPKVRPGGCRTPLIPALAGRWISECEASLVCGQPGLYSENLSRKTKQKYIKSLKPDCWWTQSYHLPFRRLGLQSSSYSVTQSPTWNGYHF